jgi:hypothetical protein
MRARSILLLVVFFCLHGFVARADDTPILPGSWLTVKDAVAKSDYVFQAKLTNLGTLEQKDSAKYVGPTYDRAAVEKPEFYKGQIHGMALLQIFVNNGYKETAPVAGQMYLFFGKQPPTGGGYPVLKILVATKANVDATIAAVLKDRAQNKLQQVQGR